MPVVADLLDFGSQTAVAGTPGGPAAKWTYRMARAGRSCGRQDRSARSVTRTFGPPVVEPVEASTSMIEAASVRKRLRAPDVSGTPTPASGALSLSR
jgi:hypothetical protein